MRHSGTLLLLALVACGHRGPTHEQLRARLTPETFPELLTVAPEWVVAAAQKSSGVFAESPAAGLWDVNTPPPLRQAVDALLVIVALEGARARGDTCALGCQASLLHAYALYGTLRSFHPEDLTPMIMSAAGWPLDDEEERIGAQRLVHYLQVFGPSQLRLVANQILASAPSAPLATEALRYVAASEDASGDYELAYLAASVLAERSEATTGDREASVRACYRSLRRDCPNHPALAKAARELAALDAKDYEGRLRRAELELALGRYEPAREHYRELAAERPDDARVTVGFAAIHFRRARWSEVFTAYTTAGKAHRDGVFYEQALASWFVGVFQVLAEPGFPYLAEYAALSLHARTLAEDYVALEPVIAPRLVLLIDIFAATVDTGLPSVLEDVTQRAAELDREHGNAVSDEVIACVRLLLSLAHDRDRATATLDDVAKRHGDAERVTRTRRNVMLLRGARPGGEELLERLYGELSSKKDGELRALVERVLALDPEQRSRAIAGSLEAGVSHEAREVVTRLGLTVTAR